MGGSGVSYNLRPNKYVERQLFVELIGHLYALKPRGDLVYVSLGGPQLEDPKLVHYSLGIKKLVSLETEEHVYKRQKFNLRPYIECLNESTGEFISHFDTLFPNKQLVVWLDYADANQRREQLGELEALIGQLGVGDTIKITMNANPNTLVDRGYRGETTEELMEKRLEKLRDTLGDYISEGVTSEDMTGARLARVLCAGIKKAALNAAQRRRRIQVVPLAIFSYQDGDHQMLTVTIYVTGPTATDVQNVKRSLNAAYWAYLPKDWEDVTSINIPNLTPKERLLIESMLFRKPTMKLATLHRKLPFRFAAKEEESLKMLEQFADHYRRYPSYLQVIL